MTAKTLSATLALLLTAGTASGQLVFNPALERQINFPDTPTGQSSELRYTATSQGRGPWTVRLATNNEQFTVNPAQFVVQDGQVVAFTLRFTPRQVGDVNGVLSGTVTSNNVVSRFSSNLFGRGIQGGDPQITVDVEEILLAVFVDELGTIWPATEATVIVGNAGNGDLHVSDISFPAAWLRADHDAFNLAPGQDVEVLFTVPQAEWERMEPDLYESTVTVTSDDPQQRQLQLPVTFDRGFIPYYLVVLGDAEPATNHAIMVEEALLGDEELQQWDEVGVFTPRGALAGSGALENGWPISMLVWGEDQQANFPGFRDGEPFAFKMWDHSAAQEYDALAEFIEGADRFENAGLSVVILDQAPQDVEQVISLRRGWDFISFRVIPGAQFWTREEGPDVIRLFASVVQNLQIAKDERGRFYAPPFNNFNNIPYVRLDRGLQVRMANQDTLRVRGRAIPPDSLITLAGGWNLAPYYPNFSLTMGSAFADLVGRNLLVMAKDATGRFYLPSLNFGANNAVLPNCGLQLNARQDCSFRYPAARGIRLAATAEANDDSVSHFPLPDMTDSNMSVLINAIVGIQVIEGAEIACLTPNGIIAGAGRFVGPALLPLGMAVWGDDSFTGGDTIEGFRDGEPVRFLYWDPLHNWELEVAFDVLDGEAIYHRDAFLYLDVIVGVNDEPSPLATRFDLSEPHPNPFNAQARIEFSLPQTSEMTLALFDLSGRRLLTLAQGRQPAGRQSLILNAAELPDGVYLLILDAGGQRLMRRAVVVK